MCHPLKRIVFYPFTTYRLHNVLGNVNLDLCLPLFCQKSAAGRYQTYKFLWRVSKMSDKTTHTDPDRLKKVTGNLIRAIGVFLVIVLFWFGWLVWYHPPRIYVA